MSFGYYSKNGQVESLDQAMVSLTNIEYSYGFGVYETIRVSKGRVLFLDDHLARLAESARIIDLEHDFSNDQVAKALSDLITANKAETCNIKILLIGAEKREDANLYIFCSQPLFPDRKLYRDGAHLVTYNYERAFPHAKTLNMLQSYLAYRQARKDGAYDALLIDREGYVREGTRTNVFCISKDTIYSPPEEDILLGVTRLHVLEIANNLGLRVEHKKLALDDLLTADSIFITSTSTKIMPVKSINDLSLKPVSEQLRRLMKQYEEFLMTTS